MKLRNRLFLAFFLFAFVPVSLIGFATLELASRGLERATSPGIEQALTQARRIVDATNAELGARALSALRSAAAGAGRPTGGQAGPARAAGLAAPVVAAPQDLLARGLDFALVAAGNDTASAWAPAAAEAAAEPGAERRLRALAQQADSVGTTVLRGRSAAFGIHRAGGVVLLGGYLLPAEHGAQVAELSGNLQRFGQLKLLASVNRRFLRLVWLAASLAYLLVILAVTRFTARSLTRPLARLGELVETVGPGHWDVRLDYERDDEIGALVDGFNRMSVRLAETTRQLVAAEKAAAWQQTARVIAHGIKNILAPVKLAVTRLARALDAEDREQTSPLETIQAELERLEKTARDFSLYGRPVREPEAPVDLNAVARQAVQLCAAQGGGAQITIVPAEPAPSALADWDMLREALVNLIKNACEATGAGGTVEVAVAQAGREARVTVTDHGPGIDPVLAERIFEPYVTSRPGGTGLGLAIVKKIVESSGGRIEFATGPGGTTFILRLPVAESGRSR